MKPSQREEERKTHGDGQIPTEDGRDDGDHAVKVAVTPAKRPARFAGFVSRTSKEFMGSQNNGR